jgi:hypothetical protein
MKKKTRTNRHYFLIKVTGQTPLRFSVKVKEAKTGVTLTRRMADILAGTEGMAVTCANAQCALREGTQAFPHPVYMAEFTDRRAYFVDKLNRYGEPVSCVRYSHHEGAFQKLYDERGKSRMAHMSGAETGFKLYPMKAVTPRGKGTSKGRDHSGTTRAQREDKRQGMGQGAIARAKRAHINVSAA